MTQRSLPASSERGSIAPIGLLSMSLLLTASLVLLCASALFQQQRRLNHLADAVALSLAHQVAVDAEAAAPLQEADYQRSAAVELSAMAGAKLRDSWLQSLDVSESGVVGLRICQPPHLDELLLPAALAGSSLGPVCSDARAGQL